MTVFLIILSNLLWICAMVTLFRRQILSPALSYLALLTLSFAERDGVALLPINTTILTGWLMMTLVVIFATMLQPEAVRRQTRGLPFIVVGALVGLAIGLLGFTAVSSLSLRYAFMIIAVIAGIFFGFLLYTNTPDGRPVGIGSGNFFKYLLAKGFPTAITMMQLGVVLVLVIAMHNMNAL